MECEGRRRALDGRSSRRVSEAVEAATSPGSERVACVRVGFPGTREASSSPSYRPPGRGHRLTTPEAVDVSTWRPTERTAGARMVPPGAGNDARGDGRRGVGVSQSTAEAGELSPRDPVEGRGHRQVAPVEGKTANTPRVGPVSTSRHRIAELARHAVGMAVAIAWLPGPAGTRRRVAKLSVEEPDAAEPARPDLWGARVSNDPGLPDPHALQEGPRHVFPARAGMNRRQEAQGSSEPGVRCLCRSLLIRRAVTLGR